MRGQLQRSRSHARKEGIVEHCCQRITSRVRVDPGHLISAQTAARGCERPIGSLPNGWCQSFHRKPVWAVGRNASSNVQRSMLRGRRTREFLSDSFLWLPRSSARRFGGLLIGANRCAESFIASICSFAGRRGGLRVQVDFDAFPPVSVYFINDLVLIRFVKLSPLLCQRVALGERRESSIASLPVSRLQAYPNSG